MKALVISGGGSKGAWAGGVCQYLIEDLNKQYDIYIGTSTGSLMCPLLSINHLETLKDAYTNIRAKDIFNINPFTVKRDDYGNLVTEMNYLSIGWNLIINKTKSFGKSTKLRDTIEKFVNATDYDNILSSKKIVQACITNLTTGKPEFKSIDSETYSDYCDWLYASAAAYPFMSPMNKNGNMYVDGGLVNHIPILRAIELGATEIDAIILSPESKELEIMNINNVLNGTMRVADVLLNEKGKADYMIAKVLDQHDNKLTINFHFTPRILINNPLIFDKSIMTEWWKEAYEYSKTESFKTYAIKNGTATLRKSRKSSNRRSL